MRVFISWAGPRGRKIAEELRRAIERINPKFRPWVSSQDLGKGSMWAAELSDEIKRHTVIMACLTRESKDRPWIMFEAGIVFGTAGKPHVSPILFGIEKQDLIEHPMELFNHTSFNKDDFAKLFRDLNKMLGSEALTDDVCSDLFGREWPNLQHSVASVLAEGTVGQSARSRDPAINAILELAREANDRSRSIEKLISALTPSDVITHQSRDVSILLGSISTYLGELGDKMRNTMAHDIVAKNVELNIEMTTQLSTVNNMADALSEAAENPSKATIRKVNVEARRLRAKLF